MKKNIPSYVPYCPVFVISDGQQLLKNIEDARRNREVLASISDLRERWDSVLDC